MEKDRLTHDQSYKWKSDTSVNSRVRKNKLLECIFGSCINRLINWVVTARRKFPGQRILASKIDYKSAYQRCHLSAETGIQTCTQLADENLAIVALILTFGGALGSYKWGVISESSCNLTIAILQDESWNPKSLCAPGLELVPKKTILNDDVPFGVGKDLIVDVPVDPKGIADVYIDDTIALGVDLQNTNNSMRLENTILLVIHVAARPIHPEEPIPREEMAALEKLLAKAGLEETKMILGLFCGFIRMTVALPTNKYVAWKSDILNMLKYRNATASKLDTIIGRLGNIGFIIHQIFHFLSRLRELFRRAKNRRSIRIDNTISKDLK